MKAAIIACLVATALPAFSTIVIVTNNRGPANTREIVPSSGTLTAGFGAFGVLSETGINGASTTFDGLGFVQFGAGGGSVTTSTSGQFSFTGDVGPAGVGAASFLSRPVYLVVGFGGTSLATSTELFIYRFTQTFGDLNSPTPVTLTLSEGVSSPGTTIFGTEVGNPATTASGRYRSAPVTVVPEPSIAILGALGALGLIRRRR